MYFLLYPKPPVDILQGFLVVLFIHRCIVVHLEFGFVVNLAVVALVLFFGYLDHSVLGANVTIAGL